MGVFNGSRITLIDTFLTVIDKINKILLIAALVLVGVVALVQVIKFAPQWAKAISKELETPSGSICPAKSGSKLCGYCNDDVILSGNPNAGKCFYCPKGTTCQGDPCGDLTCSSGGSSGTSGTSGSSGQTSNYYDLCWDCQGVSSVSYNGSDYATCAYYWSLCDIYQCRNMRRKCW